MNIKFEQGYVEVTDEIKKPKKITGTRFAALLGFNKWSTPFKTWCDITGVYREPFEDTIYTIAGKTIEPLQHKYMREHYFMQNLVSPEQVYGKDVFKKTYGDFFPDTPIFGGMWDAVLVDRDNIPQTVIEFKTTKRSEDWLNDVPEYYALQASLYAYLLGIRKVLMVCSFLDDKDYEHPENFVCDESNTILVNFDVYERYPQFATYIESCTQMYQNLSISPFYDETKDADILKVLKTTAGEVDTDMLSQLDRLKEQLDFLDLQRKPLEKQYKTIIDNIKKQNLDKFTDDVDKVEISTPKYTLKISRTLKTSVDTDKLKADDLYDKYLKQSAVFTATMKENK